MTQGSDSKPLIERRSIDYIPANERHEIGRAHV